MQVLNRVQQISHRLAALRKANPGVLTYNGTHQVPTFWPPILGRTLQKTHILSHTLPKDTLLKKYIVNQRPIFFPQRPYIFGNFSFKDLIFAKIILDIRRKISFLPTRSLFLWLWHWKTPLLRLCHYKTPYFHVWHITEKPQFGNAKGTCTSFLNMSAPKKRINCKMFLKMRFINGKFNFRRQCIT